LAETFHCDPIQLLNSDNDEWLIRMACAQALAKDQAERERKRRAVQGGY
jgi:hypothetical protein